MMVIVVVILIGVHHATLNALVHCQAKQNKRYVNKSTTSTACTYVTQPLVAFQFVEFLAAQLYTLALGNQGIVCACN